MKDIKISKCNELFSNFIDFRKSNNQTLQIENQQLQSQQLFFEEIVVLQYFNKLITKVACFVLLAILVRNQSRYDSFQIFNYPNIEFIFHSSKPENITLLWIDPINTSNFYLQAYLYDSYFKTQTFDIPSTTTLIQQVERNETSVTYTYLQNTKSYYFFKIVLENQVLARYRIINSISFISGYYEPPAYKINVIPFTIIDNFQCAIQLQSQKFNMNTMASQSSSFSIKLDILSPGLNPLIDDPTITLYYNYSIYDSFYKLKLPLLKGKWYLRNSINFNDQIVDLVTSAKIWISKNIGQTTCSLVCSGGLLKLTYIQTILYNHYEEKCYCKEPYEIYSAKYGTCYLDCKALSVLTNVNPNKNFQNQRARCQCTNPIQAFLVGHPTLTTIMSCTHICQMLPYSDFFANSIFKGQPRSVQQGCKCMYGFYWNSTQRCCFINCTGRPNTINQTSRLNSQTCYCKKNYQWDLYNLKCSLICSSINNTAGTNLAYFSDSECRCIKNYIWNGTATQCYRNCSADKNSLYTNLTKLSQCVCKTGFFWNLTAEACYRNCSIKLNSLGLNFSNVSQCICKESFVWNATKEQCYKNCSNIPNTMAINSLNVSQCICVTNFYWNSSASACFRNCSGDVGAVRTSLQNVSQCICKKWFYFNQTRCFQNCSRYVDKYANSSDGLSVNVVECKCDAGFYWNLKLAVPRCVRNCIRARDPYASGPNAFNYGICNCDIGFYWSLEVGKCVRNCTKEADRYAVGTNRTNTAICDCEPNHYWRTSDFRCVRNCTRNATNYFSGLSATDLGVCICDANFLWSAERGACVRDCSLEKDPYARSLNSANLAQCLCVENFAWSTNRMQCQKMCGSGSDDLYSVALRPGSSSECTCLPGHLWRASDLKCVRDCSRAKDLFAIDVSPKNLSACACFQGFYFNTQQSKCMRNCTKEADSYALSARPDDAAECICENNFFFRKSDSRCGRNCTKDMDPYAVGTDITLLQQCGCIANCQWNSTVSKCAPSQSYVMPLARSSPVSQGSSKQDGASALEQKEVSQGEIFGIDQQGDQQGQEGAPLSQNTEDTQIRQDSEVAQAMRPKENVSAVMIISASSFTTFVAILGLVVCRLSRGKRRSDLASPDAQSQKQSSKELKKVSPNFMEGSQNTQKHICGQNL